MLPITSAPALERSPSEELLLPVPAGQTWQVCQGYNGEITHEATPALDLSAAPRSAGPSGCLAGTKYFSAGAVITSPGSGRAHRAWGCCGNDFVCIDLDSGGSIAIGHLANRIDGGRRASPGDRIGTVAWPAPANGDYAHVHIQAHPEPGCMTSSNAVPFDAEHGFGFACVEDLPYSGEANQYSGMSVRRCESSPDERARSRLPDRGTTEERERAVDRADRGRARGSWSAPLMVELNSLSETMEWSLRRAAIW